MYKIKKVGINENDILIRPLTFFIGENGTYKSHTMKNIELGIKAFQEQGKKERKVTADIKNHNKILYDNSLQWTFNLNSSIVERKYLLQSYNDARLDFFELRETSDNNSSFTAMHTDPMLEEVSKTIFKPITTIYPKNDIGHYKTHNIYEETKDFYQDSPLTEQILFLLEHPDLGLDPKKAAKFTSKCIKTIRDFPCTFIIETYNDYVIDRARIEILEGNLDPNNLVFVHFETINDKGKEGIKITNITFDKCGNMNNTPKKFRNWFIQEANRLMGWDLKKDRKK